jgi:hypothetical protein
MLQDDMVSASYEYYKGLIAFRKAHPALRMTDQAEILAAMEVLETGSNDVIAILNNGGNGEKNKILTIINASTNPYDMTLPEGEWDIYVDHAVASDKVIATVDGAVCVNGTSVMILVQNAPFEDIPEDSFYAEAVMWAVKNGVTNGKGDGLFHPNDEVTRAEVVTFLWRAAGEPVVKSDKSFPDVSEGDFFYNAVIWAAEEGITTGKDNGLFDPYATCTRAEALTFLWRAEDTPMCEQGTVNEFSDVAVNDYFAPAVMWALSKGITNGMSNGIFGSYEICNRAHIVTFLYRAMAD